MQKYSGKTKNDLEYILIVDQQGFYLSVYNKDRIIVDHIIQASMTKEEVQELADKLGEEISLSELESGT